MSGRSVSRRGRRAAVIAAMVLLSACGGSGGRDGPPVDEQLVSRQRQARQSFERGAFDAAALLYGQALDRAYERDDLKAIADIAYNLGITELRRFDADRALAVARRARAEQVRRGVATDPGLTLVEAVALYRLGRPAEAQAAIERVLASGDAAAATVDQAVFVGGLIAADRADVATVESAIAALGTSATSSARADRLELEARARLLGGAAAGARSAAMEAVGLRRDALDYAGMARALALAGAAAEAEADAAAAASLYLQAGRSAVQQGDRQNAARWLDTARTLARRAGDPRVAADAQRWLDELSTRREPRSPS